MHNIHDNFDKTCGDYQPISRQESAYIALNNYSRKMSHLLTMCAIRTLNDNAGCVTTKNDQSLPCQSTSHITLPISIHIYSINTWKIINSSPRQYHKNPLPIQRKQTHVTQHYHTLGLVQRCSANSCCWNYQATVCRSSAKQLNINYRQKNIIYAPVIILQREYQSEAANKNMNDFHPRRRQRQVQITQTTAAQLSRKTHKKKVNI